MTATKVPFLFSDIPSHPESLTTGRTLVAKGMDLWFLSLTPAVEEFEHWWNGIQTAKVEVGFDA